MLNFVKSYSYGDKAPSAYFLSDMKKIQKAYVSISIIFALLIVFFLTKDGEVLFNKRARECSSLERVLQLQCLEESLRDILEKQGVDAAFEFLAQDIYPIEPDCHGYVHLIGEEAYKFFSQGKDIKLSPKTSYCGYGFFHGFMEILIHDSGDLKIARDFCTSVDRQLKGSSGTACYHGIGHGSVDGSDPRAWGDANAMLQPAAKICDLTGETEFQRYLCATGMYNSIEILSRDPKYKLSAVQEDPFSLCKEYATPGLFQEACYTNMVPAVLSLTQNDFFKTAEYIEEHMQNEELYTIEGYKVREMVIASLSHELIRFRGLNGTIDVYIEEGITLCRSLPEHSRLACFEGLGGGHLKYGKPETEYIKAIDFCRHPLLREDERTSCFKHILTRLLNLYSPTKARAICETVDELYRKQFCQWNTKVR